MVNEKVDPELVLDLEVLRMRDTDVLLRGLAERLVDVHEHGHGSDRTRRHTGPAETGLT